MGNIIFKFNRRFFQKLTLLLTLHVIIDDKETVKILPDTSVDLELDEGTHTIYASFPYQGNELGTATIKFDVQPQTRYELTYTANYSGVGKITVKEIK